MGVAKNHQLGTNERTQEKIEKIKQFSREAQVSSDDGAEVQGLRDALSVLQTRERELHQQLEEANRRVERERERAEVNNCISVANMFVVNPWRACAGSVTVVCLCVCVCVCLSVTTLVASSPGSLGGGEKESLVTTACACANLTRKTW